MVSPPRRQRRSGRARAVPSSDLLAKLSHELRESLNVILGWAHVLRDPNIDRKTVVHGAEVICENVEIQSRLITDLLDGPQVGAKSRR